MKNLATIAFATLLFSVPCFALADEREGSRDGYSLAISGSATARTGRPAVLTVRGVNPTKGPVEGMPMETRYLTVVAFDANTINACPNGQKEALQLAQTTDGQRLAVMINEAQDSTGTWSATVAAKPRTGGRKLLCAYTADGFGYAFRKASFVMNVTRAKR